MKVSGCFISQGRINKLQWLNAYWPQILISCSCKRYYGVCVSLCLVFNSFWLQPPGFLKTRRENRNGTWSYSQSTGLNKAGLHPVLQVTFTVSRWVAQSSSWRPLEAIRAPVLAFPQQSVASATQWDPFLISDLQNTTVLSLCDLRSHTCGNLSQSPTRVVHLWIDLIFSWEYKLS